MPSSSRVPHGEIQRQILELMAAGDPSRRYTPAILANELGEQQGSIYAATKRLAAIGKVKVYGKAPLMVGHLPAAADNTSTEPAQVG